MLWDSDIALLLSQGYLFKGIYFKDNSLPKRRFYFKRRGEYYCLKSTETEEHLINGIKLTLNFHYEKYLEDEKNKLKSEIFLTNGTSYDKLVVLKRFLDLYVGEFKKTIDDWNFMNLEDDIIVDELSEILRKNLDIILEIKDNRMRFMIDNVFFINSNFLEYNLIDFSFTNNINNYSEKVISEKKYFQERKTHLFLLRNIEWIKNEISIIDSDEIINTKNEMSIPKFKWKGTPAQLACIFDMLQNKGWIDGLTPSGEKNGRLMLSHFEFIEHSPTPESLGKCFQKLNKDESPISKEDAALFLKFPNRNDLNR